MSLTVSYTVRCHVLYLVLQAEVGWLRCPIGVALAPVLARVFEETIRTRTKNKWGLYVRFTGGGSHLLTSWTAGRRGKNVAGVGLIL